MKTNNLASVAAVMAVVALAASGSAQAAIDVTEVSGAITDASTALMSVVGALLTLSVGIFGVTKVYRFISKKAGA